MGTDGPTVLEPLWHGLPALDTAALSGSASCALPARFEAVKNARTFTHKTLQRWELQQEFDGVAVVVSELVTNALRHGVPSAPPAPGAGATLGAGAALGSAAVAARPGTGTGAGTTAAPRTGVAGDPPVRLHLMRWSSRLVCAVRDPSAHAPRAVARNEEFDELLGFADCAAESGRGLWLVDSFSDYWGWHRLTGSLSGKVVWAMFRLRPTAA
ncbi:ATP-binding protein [Streptomyces sp. Z26]|uniref:ATP-binding protein n=1 Tax=Streptomyces sp. Z26 TaxID=2500177 RepID=UPI000EF15819|nr:ATP-binding protein [Streptomyces sp. Z26]RLL68218.1 ATP-binding protein [Streptomyces sp. Z26]